MNLVWLKYERFVNNEGISLKTPLLLLIFRGKYDTIFLRKTQEKKKDEGKERGRKGADENACEEDCIEACRQACADEFIERMPDKYNTWIEQGGSNVSGGQRQRLCIARALLKHPKVLILDDSTSAVDTATDAKIKKAFATKIPGTTKIIVSQRISSIQDADRILVLENGCVSGFDTHENLVENNKVYREIYEVQTQGGGDFDEAGE